MYNEPTNNLKTFQWSGSSRQETQFRILNDYKNLYSIMESFCGPNYFTCARPEVLRPKPYAKYAKPFIFQEFINFLELSYHVPLSHHKYTCTIKPNLVRLMFNCNF